MRGMVIIDSNHYGKSMELVECIKDKIMELVETLSYAEMGEKSRERYEDKERYSELYDRDAARRMMPRGRYNY